MLKIATDFLVENRIPRSLFAIVSVTANKLTVEFDDGRLDVVDPESEPDAADDATLGVATTDDNTEDDGWKKWDWGGELLFEFDCGCELDDCSEIIELADTTD